MLPISEKKIENSSKGVYTKAHTEQGNLEEKPKKNTACLVEAPISGDESLKLGVEVGNPEVEYVDSENLNDVEDVDMSLKTVLAGLDSKDCVLLCEALIDVCRLSIFHKRAMVSMVENVIPLIVKSLKNSRIAICKTAIMSSADIFSTYSDQIIDSLDPLLVPLLLTSSQDKRFVCEAADRALVSMTTWLSPILLLPKLQPYLKNRNPRIRAKASMCICRSVPRLRTVSRRQIWITNFSKWRGVKRAKLCTHLLEEQLSALTLLHSGGSVFKVGDVNLLGRSIQVVGEGLN